LRLLGFDGSLGRRLLLESALLLDLGPFHFAGREPHLGFPHLLRTGLFWIMVCQMALDLLVEISWFTQESFPMLLHLGHLLWTEIWLFCHKVIVP
jgi:hypothetical protein